FNVQIAADGADLDVVSAGLGAHRAANIFHADGATTGLSIDAAGNRVGGDASAVRFDFPGLHFAWNIDHQFAGRTIVALLFPLAHDAGHIAVHGTVDSVVLEHAAGFFLRRSGYMAAQGVVDALSRSALDADAAALHFNV